MVYADPLHIDRWGVYATPTTVSTKRGELTVEVNVTNDSEVEERRVTILNELFDADGHSVAR